MKRTYPDRPWCRYADDGLVHLKTEEEGQEMLLGIKRPFEEYELELHSVKTRIVYCKDGNYYRFGPFNRPLA